MAAMPEATSALNLGFLSIAREGTGYLGGYLLTNSWGRPLEFRLTSAVHPNRVQHILYGPSLESYVCAELIGKTLIDKTAIHANAVLTDHPAVLDLRLRIDIPVGLVSHESCAGAIRGHAHFVRDTSLFRELAERLGNFDFTEPFGRIREAIREARKLGVAKHS